MNFADGSSFRHDHLSEREPLHASGLQAPAADCLGGLDGQALAPAGGSRPSVRCVDPATMMTATSASHDDLCSVVLLAM